MDNSSVAEYFNMEHITREQWVSITEADKNPGSPADRMLTNTWEDDDILIDIMTRSWGAEDRSQCPTSVM